MDSLDDNMKEMGKVILQFQSNVIFLYFVLSIYFSDCQSMETYNLLRLSVMLIILLKPDVKMVKRLLSLQWVLMLRIEHIYKIKLIKFTNLFHHLVRTLRNTQLISKNHGNTVIHQVLSLPT